MQSDPNVPWVEKYRPRKLDDISQNECLINLFKNSIKTANLTHFLFYGPPGTGKTSAILAIGRELFKEYFPTRVVEFNASDDRGINAVREKISNEARKDVTEAISEDGTIIPAYKIIILDEADSMTDEAQDALRVIIEQHSRVTRFCFICNSITKIADAIKSRCATIYFKKLNDECMVNKLAEISKKESMDLSEEILKTIINISNGDMRKAIMLLQNLKYLYKFKNRFTKQLNEMTIKELNSLAITDINSERDSNITVSDIYEIASSIDMKMAHNIIKDTIACKRIIDVSVLTKQIISKGYPIDNILSQLNKEVIETNILTDDQKAGIIQYSGKILFKIKECANEYIQLLDYLACVHGIYQGNTVYTK